MKQFNLQAAIEGSPVVTRDGRKVTEIHLFYTASTTHPLHACIDKKIYQFTKDGTAYMDRASHLDLLMEEPIVVGWVNIYYQNITGNMWTGDVWPTYEQAVNTKEDSLNYIKTIKIDNQPE